MNDFVSIVRSDFLFVLYTPCIFITCAVFIALGLWSKKNYLPMALSGVIFVLVYALNILIFNFGPGQDILFQKNYVFTAKLLYFILGLWALVSGILFFKDWLSIRRGSPVESLPSIGKQGNLFAGLAVLLISFISGFVLSVLAAFWPIDNYIILSGNEAFIKGQGQTMRPLLLGYIFISMWPIVLVWAFLSIKNLRPSLLKIVCAAIFFTASSCMILMFK